MAVHEGAFSVEREACGGLVFRDAGGKVIEAAPALPVAEEEPADAWSLVASDGSPVQWDYVFDVLAASGA